MIVLSIAELNDLFTANGAHALPGGLLFKTNRMNMEGGSLPDAIHYEHRQEITDLLAAAALLRDAVRRERDIWRREGPNFQATPMPEGRFRLWVGEDRNENGDITFHDSDTEAYAAGYGAMMEGA